MAAFLAILLIYAEVRLYAEARIGRTGEGLGRTGGQRANRPVTRASQWRLHKERRASVTHNKKKKKRKKRKEDRKGEQKRKKQKGGKRSKGEKLT